MRILIVKLSSLGDVVHAMPVVHDIRSAWPHAQIDWVVEPAFAPLVRQVVGVQNVLECPLRRWRRAWWTSAVRSEWREFRAQLQSVSYDAVIDLQGLTKSAVIASFAHGPSHGLANRTEGSSFEAPARWLVDHPIHIAPRTHALDRSRQVAAFALRYELVGAPQVQLRVSRAAQSELPTLLFAHGSSRADKLWPQASWIDLGKRVSAGGWQIALPRAGVAEHDRYNRIADAIGSAAVLWPELSLSDLVGRISSTQGVIGVDSGLSHVAVALNLPHVQIYNFPTAWRTGPRSEHGRSHQVSVQSSTTPSCDVVWDKWLHVMACDARQHGLRTTRAVATCS